MPLAPRIGMSQARPPRPTFSYFPDEKRKGRDRIDCSFEDRKGKNALMVSWTLVFHVFGIVLWIGGLLTTTVLLTLHTREEAPEARAAFTRIEKKSLRMMADPGALLTIAAGITLIFTNKAYYMHAAWLHVKLAIVVVLIGLHGYIGVSTKRVQMGTKKMTPGQALLLLVAVLVVFLAILIVTLPGEVYLLH